MFLQLAFEDIHVGARLQLQVYGTDLGGVLEQLAGKLQGGNNIRPVVLLLVHSKHQSRRKQVAPGKGRSRIGHVHLRPTLGCIHLQRVEKADAGTQIGQQLHARNGIVHYLIVKQQLTLSEKDGINRSQFGEIVFHSLDHGHGLPSLILHQGIVFQRLTHQSHFRHLPDGHDGLVLPIEHLSSSRYHLQFRVESRKQIRHQILEAVEHGQGTHQGQGGQRHSAHRDARNHIDGIVRLLGKQISPCYVKREIHRYTFLIYK